MKNPSPLINEVDSAGGITKVVVSSPSICGS
jgi:hypothetical protein